MEKRICHSVDFDIKEEAFASQGSSTVTFYKCQPTFKMTSEIIWPTFAFGGQARIIDPCVHQYIFNIHTCIFVYTCMCVLPVCACVYIYIKTIETIFCFFLFRNLFVFVEKLTKKFLKNEKGNERREFDGAAV